MIDIQVGDRVVCVAVPPRPFPHKGLRVGAVYLVEDVFEGITQDREPAIGVRLRGIDPSPMKGFVADAFRKVSPKSASKHIEDLKKLPERAREMEEL